MRRLGYALINLYCIDCGRVIWFWQSRCRVSHSSCAHAAILRAWRINRDATGGPAQPWECAWCHTTPTEARP